MRRLGLLFLVLLAACSTVEPTPGRLGASIPISQWPIPASGSPNITNGDAFVGTRGGVSYKLVAGFGGTCASNNWVSSINSQGVPVCTQPGFSSLTGFVALNQLAGLYSNGQLLIGNGSTGFLQAGTLAATNNISIANSAGGISVNGSLTPTFTSATFSPSTGGIIGTTTNNNASAGVVGEYQSSTVLVGSAVSLTTATAANITSMSLTAGDWEVCGSAVSSMAAGTTMTSFQGWISTTSASLPIQPNNGMAFVWNGSVAGTSQNVQFSTGCGRLSLSTTTSVYLSAQAAFSGSTDSAYGFIGARRVR